MPPLLWTSYFRYLRQNWWLPLFSLCAIATGVAVILGIDLASISARRSFALSTQAMTGSATHSVVGNGRTVPDQLLRQLRLEQRLRRSAPVVEGYLKFPEAEGQPTLSLLGVDLLSDGLVRDWTTGRVQGGAQPAGGFGRLRLLGSADQVVASRATAQRLGWQVGQTQPVEVGGRTVRLTLAGVLEPSSAALAAATDNLLLADIATAQTILQQQGLDRIDLVLTAEEAKRLQLPAGTSLQRAGTSQQTAAELSAAFHTSLSALSYLCLLVATFLIFNVVSFSVAHRRQSLGRLRVLGVTSSQLGWLLLGETMLLALAGSGLGTALGVLLGRGLVPLVARSLDDLYYVISITRFAVAPSLLAKAFLCGLLATAVGGLVPSWLAARAQPLELLWRVDPPRAHRWARWSALAGLLTLGGAGLLLLHPGLTAGLLSLLAMVLGYGLLVPTGLIWSLRLGRVLFPRALASRMALQGLRAHFARAAVAAVALTVAVAATVSIALMVSSFRGTLTRWLQNTLTADVYLTLRDRSAVARGATLAPGAVDRAIAGLPGVREWTGQRALVVPSETGETLLVGMRGGREYVEAMQFLELAEDGRERFFRGEGVFLTEPYARRSGKGVGSTLTVATPPGERTLPVLGVYYSYAPDRNSALLGHLGFEPLFGAGLYSGLAFYLQPGQDSASTVATLRGLFGETVEVRATAQIRALALEIFERTFTVTEVLRLLALGVAGVGVLLSLLALAIERESEVQVLRALGVARGQLLGLALVQSAWLGAMTGLLACPLGLLLAQVMIKVLNRRAFGWTISYLPDPWALGHSLALGLLASLLAGLYPAWRWSRTPGDQALRERE